MQFYIVHEHNAIWLQILSGYLCKAGFSVWDMVYNNFSITLNHIIVNVSFSFLIFYTHSVMFSNILLVSRLFHLDLEMVMTTTLIMNQTQCKHMVSHSGFLGIDDIGTSQVDSMTLSVYK